MATFFAGAHPSPSHAADRHPRDRLERQLSLADATLLVVSCVIGVGVFLTPGAVADLLPHPGLVLLAWLVGGLLSLAGALANAELGGMYPHAGGDYVYLREAFHPAAGFLVGWLSFFVIFAGTVATLAIGFAEGVAPWLGLGVAGRIGVALLLVLALSVLNALDVRLGAVVNNVTAAAKVLALGGLAVAGPLLGGGSLANLQPLMPDASAVPWSAFGLALAPVLFTYLGWNASVYVASELREPDRTLPRSLFLGLAICAAVYLVVNVAYLYALPIGVLRGTVSAGEAAATVFFGPFGGTIVSMLVLVSIASCLNANVMLGPRVIYAMALDGLFLRSTERVHLERRTPYVAIAVQAVTAAVLMLTLQAFPRLLDYTTFAIVVATMADTVALYVLRRRRPDLRRPYRAWGYPVVPAFYLLANAGIAASMLWGHPTECAVALGVAATGLPFYAFFVRRARVR